MNHHNKNSSLLLKKKIIFSFFLFLFIQACSPSKKTSVIQTSAYQQHTVVPGENIGKVANTYEVSEEEIKLLNPDADLKHLKTGQVIKIPLKKAETKKEIKEEKTEIIKEKKITTSRIALLLPLNAGLHAEKNISDLEINIDPSTLPWIHFYQGIVTALDSLVSEGNNYEITLYDTQSDSAKLIRMIRDSLFIKNDLVIGAGVTYWLPQLTSNASKNGKPLIIAQNNSASFLTGHPELILTTPSVALQCQMMSEYIYRNFQKENIVIIHQETKKEKDLADIFITALEISRLKSGNTDSLQLKNLVYSTKLFDKGYNLLDKQRNNIIIIPSSDEAFVSPIISRLDSLKDFRFTVCGIPTWENFESIDPQKLQKLQTHIFSTTYIDYQNKSVMAFRKNFLEKYKSDPLYNAYLGFSIAYLSGTILEKKDTQDFVRQLAQITTSGLPVKFDFQSGLNEDGKENRSFTILKYDNFKLLRLE